MRIFFFILMLFLVADRPVFAQSDVQTNALPAAATSLVPLRRLMDERLALIVVSPPCIAQTSQILPNYHHQGSES